jgi:hypothetical protein
MQPPAAGRGCSRDRVRLGWQVVGVTVNTWCGLLRHVALLTSSAGMAATRAAHNHVVQRAPTEVLQRKVRCSG